MFFFFQAEDGIRDRSPSRGLGDVYKRQLLERAATRECQWPRDQVCHAPQPPPSPGWPRVTRVPAPIPDRIPSVTTVHSVTISDPYAWLDDLDDPTVLAHLEAETIYADEETS